MRVPILALAGVLSLALTCSGDEPDGAPTPTSFPPLEETPGPTAVPPPLPTPGPEITELPHTLWLIDAVAGRIATLHQDADRNIAFHSFVEDSPGVIFETYEGDDNVTVRLDYQGNELERETGSTDLVTSLLWPLPWRQTEDGCEVDGRLYEGVNCGSMSPSGRWMTFHRNTRLPQPHQSEYEREYDLWVVDLETGETRELQQGLFQCGQCDSGPTVNWSWSERYLFTHDAGRDNRVFLMDVEAGTSRRLPAANDGTRPEWSPVADLMARPSEAGATLIEDPATGASRELGDLPWPVRFDPSGTYLYSLASYGGPPQLETRVVRVEDGETLATLAGGVGYDPSTLQQRRLSVPGDALVRSGDSFVAALAAPPGCDGTVVYAGTQAVTCVERGGAASVSPDAARVALLRKTGVTGPVRTPGFQSVGIDIYEVVVVDLATGEQRVVAQDALSAAPPHMTWNAEGTHLLVRWPHHYGP